MAWEECRLEPGPLGSWPPSPLWPAGWACSPSESCSWTLASLSLSLVLWPQVWRGGLYKEGQPSQQRGVQATILLLELIRNGMGAWEGEISWLSVCIGNFLPSVPLPAACCLAAGLPRQEATVPPLLVSREQGHTQSPVCLYHLLGPVAFVTGATCGCARF